MKKIISLLLVFVLTFGLVACNNTSTDYLNETVSIDTQELKDNWQKGEITFANGETITLPCSYSDFISISNLTLYNNENFVELVIDPFNSVMVNGADSNTMISFDVANTINPESTDVVIKSIKLYESTTVKVTIEDIKEGNRDIKFANSLTVGALRQDVETALGIPEGATADSTTYTYVSEKITLTVTFNEKDVVNEISYEYDYKN